MASTVTTGRREPTPRDTKDKGTLLQAGRLMSRRTDREIKALKVTVASLEEELARARAGREGQDLAAAMRRTDGGIAIKVLQKEVSALRNKVAVAEQERDAALAAAIALSDGAPSTPSSAPGNDGEAEAARRQSAALQGKVAELEHRLAEVQAYKTSGTTGSPIGPSSIAAGKLEKEVRSARHEVEVLNEDKTKLAAQLKLVRAQQKQAEEDAAREAKQLNDRLSTASRRIETLEADLARARTAASAIKADHKEVATLLRQKDEACEMRLEERERAHRDELADTAETLEETETRHAESERRWAAALNEANAETQVAKKQVQQVTAELEKWKHKTAKAPTPAEVKASSERILAQTKELNRLNSEAAVHKLEDAALKKRIASDRAALEQAAEDLKAAREAQRSAEDVAPLLNERITELERARERQEGTVRAQMCKIERHEREVVRLRDALGAETAARAGAEEERDRLRVETEVRGEERASGVEEGTNECGEAKEIESRLLVAKLERKIVSLQAEKALALNNAQASITALENALAAMCDQVGSDEDFGGVDEDESSASTVALLDACGLIDGFKRAGDQLVSGLASLRGNTASMLIQLREPASKGRVRIASLY